ncbi:MAG: DMT family transporter [Bacteroidales bacterium]|nr:DMT family transporter [Bacteroidales bacterium]
MKTNNASIHVLALLSMIFWGMSYIWSKVVFTYLDPIVTVFIRLIISAITLLLILTITRKWQPIKKVHLPLFLLSSLFNPFLYFICESLGLQLVTPTLSAVIIATIPVFTPMVAYLLLKEKLKLLNLFGLVVSIVGVLIIVFDKSINEQAVSWPGILLLFGAVIAAVGHGILLKKLTYHYNPVMIISTQNITGILYFLPLVIFFRGDDTMLLPPDAVLITNLLLLGIFASSLAYVFYTASVKKFGIARSSLYANLIPVFTAIFSYFLLKEIISLQKLSGILIVIIGVILSEYNAKPIKV